MNAPEPKPSPPTEAYVSPSPETAAVSTAVPGLSSDPATVVERVPELGTFGRYQLRRVLGEGGMGSVYLAYDSQLDRTVALKIPKLTGGSPVQRERFLREARAAALLAHPAICPVYDVGEVEGKPYLTLAYVDGPSLAQVLRERGPLAPRDAARLLLAVARGMQHAHEQGILHRDLKPGNILLNGQGEPSVTDFGLAFRFDDETGERLTEPGLVVGTPAYMPPEQISGQTLGPSSDVYSLGVVLYELLTGKAPFEAPLGKLLALIDSAPPAPPSQLRPDVDPVLEAICLKALAKRPDDRFADMAGFAQALEGYLQGQATATDFTPAAKGRRRHWRLVGVAVAVGVLGVVVAWVTGFLPPGRPPSEAEPTARLAPEPTPPVVERKEPAVDAPQEALARLLASVSEPIRKIEYELGHGAPARAARDALPPDLLKEHTGPLSFKLSGSGEGHVVDLTDQPGQSAQLERFSDGDVTILGPYLLFLGDIGDRAQVYIKGGPAISILAPMDGASGGLHIEFDGTHLLQARNNPATVDSVDASPADLAALRNRELTRKVTFRYPRSKVEHVIYTRPDVQIVPEDPAQRKALFPEVHNLIELDGQRQGKALTITDEQLREARAGIRRESLPAPTEREGPPIIPRGMLAGDQVMPAVTNARLKEILESLSIKSLEAPGPREGIRVYDFERNDIKIRLLNDQGRDLWIDVVFSNKIALHELNQWNVRSKFSRAVLVNHGDKAFTNLEAQLDCEGGVTEGMIRQFILRFDDEIKQFVEFLTR